jgi:hypothetical protein
VCPKQHEILKQNKVWNDASSLRILFSTHSKNNPQKWTIRIKWKFHTAKETEKSWIKYDSHSYFEHFKESCGELRRVENEENESLKSFFKLWENEVGWRR